MEFRNIGIIAHVDHGKTTLVDAMLKQCNTFRANENVADRVMDSMDLERERGITIAAKNTSVVYKDIKVNIVDTPGHADFGGEVERILSMVDGAVLLVDAAEGCLPQTRYVLDKALKAGLTMMVCVNKIDRPDARPAEVLDQIYDLFIDVGADEDQLEFPVFYAIGKDGIAKAELDDDSTDLRPLLDGIIEHMPAPRTTTDADPRLLITQLGYDSYVGQLAIGRLVDGALEKTMPLTLFTEEGPRKVRAQFLYNWDGLTRTEVPRAEAGDIIAIAGIKDINIGDTIAGGAEPEALDRVNVDEPTIGMHFSINTSPLSGQEGKFVTARQIRERLEKEMMHNVSLRLEPGETAEAFKVFGRGELQLAVLIEQMRREGFELTVSRPEVVKREIDGEIREPWEQVTLDLPDFAVGTATEKMAGRKGQMLDMVQDGSGRTRLVYRIATRALIGFRGEYLTDTRGEGIMNTLFDGWGEDIGFLRARARGALVADRSGKTTQYALYNLQPRGTLFLGAGEEVYEGMIVGEHSRENDLNVNPVRPKQLTNVRSAGADEKTTLSPHKQLSLEAAIEWLDEDEYVEITPVSIRLRKKVLAGNQRSIVRRERK